MDDGEIQPNEQGTPQGGSISVLLSNVYLHYVLDLWFERVVKPRLRGEAYLVRYIDDFVVCFQYRADALRVRGSRQNAVSDPSHMLRPRVCERHCAPARLGRGGFSEAAMSHHRSAQQRRFP
jgi:hypothetical protein